MVAIHYDKGYATVIAITTTALTLGHNSHRKVQMMSYACKHYGFFTGKGA